MWPWAKKLAAKIEFVFDFSVNSSPDIRGGAAVPGGSRLWRVAPGMKRIAEPRLAGLTRDLLQKS